MWPHWPLGSARGLRLGRHKMPILAGRWTRTMLLRGDSIVSLILGLLLMSDIIGRMTFRLLPRRILSFRLCARLAASQS